MSQDLRDPALRFMLVISVVGKLHYYFMPGDCSLRTFCRNINISADLFQIRDHKAKAFRLLIRTHHLCKSMGKNLHNPGFLSSASLSLQKFYLYLILMEGTVHTALRNVQIFASAFDLHKAKAFGMTDKSTHKASAFFPFGILATLGNLKSSLHQQFVQNRLQFLPFFGTNLHKGCQFLFLHGNIKLVIYQLTY